MGTTTETMAAGRDEKLQAELEIELAKLPRHERIAHLRALNNMSQQDLADRLAPCQRGTVSTWEQPGGGNGRSAEPSKIMRIKLGYVFGVPPHVFTDEWGKQPKAPYGQRAKGKAFGGGKAGLEPKPEPAREAANAAAGRPVSGVRRIQ